MPNFGYDVTPTGGPNNTTFGGFRSDTTTFNVAGQKLDSVSVYGNFNGPVRLALVEIGSWTWWEGVVTGDGTDKWHTYTVPGGPALPTGVAYAIFAEVESGAYTPSYFWTTGAQGDMAGSFFSASPDGDTTTPLQGVASVTYAGSLSAHAYFTYSPVSTSSAPDAPATALEGSGTVGAATYIDVYPSSAYNDADADAYASTSIQYSLTSDTGPWTEIESVTTRPTSGAGAYRILTTDVSATTGDSIYVRMADADDTDGLGSYGTVLSTFFPLVGEGTDDGGGDGHRPMRIGLRLGL